MSHYQFVFINFIPKSKTLVENLLDYFATLLYKMNLKKKTKQNKTNKQKPNKQTEVTTIKKAFIVKQLNNIL